MMFAIRVYSDWSPADIHTTDVGVWFVAVPSASSTKQPRSTPWYSNFVLFGNVWKLLPRKVFLLLLQKQFSCYGIHIFTNTIFPN